MKSSKAFLASVFITAVLLVAVGVITTVVAANRNASAREAAYNQLIEQANQQIEKANAEIQAMQNQVAQTQPAAQAAAAPADPAPAVNAQVSPDQASKIAAQVADPGQTVLKTPDLVDFQGKTAYEVPFDKGPIYVDAQTGEVLFNSTVPQTITADMAAKVASDYMHDKNVLQVDQITFRGQTLYRVIFKNGIMLYMDLTGQITYINKGGPSSQLAAADSGGGGGGGGGGHHEDNHEGGDD